ncbi:hypothetical protein [Kocuria rosea]|uniref:hypothetical protein n=1 Tax=Kocuria rosea TaxID=1275 RepID=UPI001269EE09|nr:hypothetical protein [Kocuria polaris]
MPTDECRTPGCDRPRAENDRCPRHARTWRNHAVRCYLCNQIIERADTVRDFSDPTVRPKIHGRTEWWTGPLGLKTLVSLGRCHERWHLLRDARHNRRLLAEQLTLDPDFPDCWTWTGPLNPAGRPLFVPHGGDPKFPWLAYRAMWGVTQPGPLKRGWVLDHAGCRAADGTTVRNIRCVSPLHLKPRTQVANQKRVGTRASAPIAAHATPGTLFIGLSPHLPWPLDPALLQTYDVDALRADIAEQQSHEMTRLHELLEKAGL